MADGGDRERKGPTFDIKATYGVTDARDKSGGKHINHSFFGCLLNTNYKPKDRESLEMMGKEYPRILEEVLSQNDDLMKRSIMIVDDITTHDDGRKTFTTHEISQEEYESDIKHIRSRFKAEVGNDYGKGGRFHMHCSFFIVHTTKIQLDLKPIVDAYNVELEAHGLPTIKYFKVKSEKPNTDLYMTKYNFV